MKKRFNITTQINSIGIYTHFIYYINLMSGILKNWINIIKWFIYLHSWSKVRNKWFIIIWYINNIIDKIITYIKTNKWWWFSVIGMVGLNWLISVGWVGSAKEFIEASNSWVFIIQLNHFRILLTIIIRCFNRYANYLICM